MLPILLQTLQKNWWSVTQMPEMKYLDIVTLVRDVAVISGIQKQISQKPFSPWSSFITLANPLKPGKCLCNKTKRDLHYENIKSGLVTVSTSPQNHSSRRVPTLCPCNGVCWGSKLGSKKWDEINCYRSPHTTVLCEGRQMYPTITWGSEWKVHRSQTDSWHPSFLKRDSGFNTTLISRKEFSLPRNTVLF